MTDALPIPPVPPECDLRDFGFIPLEFMRLFASETWLLANDAEKVAALHLWCRSWHQVPAASLPDEDRVLAKLSESGAKWKRIRPRALRGWTKCSDGRLYHFVVAEKALDAWQKKLEQRQRTHAARVAKLRKQIEHTTGEERFLLEQQLQGLLQAPVTGSKGQGQLKGQGREGTGKGLETFPAAGAASLEVGVLAWNAYAAAYQGKYGVPPVRNGRVNSQLAQFVRRVPAADAPAIAEFYVSHNLAKYVRAAHPVGLLLADAEGLHTQWKTGVKVTDTTARQADRSSATVDSVNDLLREASRRPG